MGGKRKSKSTEVGDHAKGQPSADMGLTLTGDSTPGAETRVVDGTLDKKRQRKRKTPKEVVDGALAVETSFCKNLKIRSSSRKGVPNAVLPRSSSRKGAPNGGRSELTEEEKREKKSAQNRKFYQKMSREEKEKLVAAKRKRRQAMTEEEKKQYREKQREYKKKFVAKNRARINARSNQQRRDMSPETRKAHLAARRQKRRLMTPEQRASENQKRRKSYQSLPEEKKQKKREKVKKYRQQHPMSTSAKTRKIAKQRERRSAMPPQERRELWLRQYELSREAILLRCKQPATCTWCRKTVTASALNHHVAIHRKCSQLHSPLTQKQREEIEEISRGGASSDGGKRVRQYRVTATRAKEVLTWTKHGKDLSVLARNYSHLSGESFKSQYMKDGQNFERNAIDAYQQAFEIPDENIQKKVGLLVHSEFGYLGATPDARFISNDGQKGSLEVKYIVKGISTASYLLRQTSRVWTPGKRGSYVTPVPRKGGEIRQLNRNHTYFTQVVMQVMCGGFDFGDFVVYSKNKKNPKKWDMWRETITREEADLHWNDMEPILTNFFNTVLGPQALYTGVITRSVADLN